MSSNRDNFAGGFLLGAIVGGVLGGVVGAMIASPRSSHDDDLNDEDPLSLKESAESKIEMARRGLEDKIAQLNSAIDDARQQLSNVNGNTNGMATEGDDDRVFDNDDT